MRLLALDVALLPPPPVREMAVHLSEALPRAASKGLVLDAEHLPHVTLTQHFIDVNDTSRVLVAIDDVLADTGSLRLHVPGAGKARHTVWITIERSPVLLALHERLMNALEPFERQGGGPSAFYGGDARPGDVQWVANYRNASALAAFTPHITLGHANAPPRIEPFDFEANVVAACHLGRFCTCRQALKTWRLNHNRS